MSSPVSGSVTPMDCSRSTRIGPDQLRPLSVERSTRTVQPRSLSVFSLLNSANAFTRVPLGRTTIWLPIVWSFCPGSYSWRAGSQLTPPLVLRANQIGPRNAEVRKLARTLAASLEGKTSRSHTP
jgi:hypothetical protein